MVRQRGFTYIAIILAVALLSATLAATGVVWHVVQKRAKEEELLYVGDQFRRAVASYARKPAGGVVGALPRELDDLIKDPRDPGVLRHLRKIYVDPMTGTTEWGIVRTEEGGIQGVYSLSEDKPIKTGNFKPDNKEFADKAKYSDWKFVFGEEQARKAGLPGRGTAPVPGAPPAPGAAAPGQQPLAPGQLPFGQVPLGQQAPGQPPPGTSLTAPADTGQPQAPLPQVAPPVVPPEEEPEPPEEQPPAEEPAPSEPPPSREDQQVIDVPETAPAPPPAEQPAPPDTGGDQPAPPGASEPGLLQPIAPAR